MEKVPSVIQYNADFDGCGFWRLLWPQMLLNMRKVATVSHSQLYIRDFVHYAKADCLILQRQGKPKQYEFFSKLSQLRERMEFRMVYEIDDLTFYEDIPDYNMNKKHFKDKEIVEKTKAIIEMCDEMVVPTHFMREYYLQKTEQKNISVIPNFPPMFWIGSFYSEALLVRNYKKHQSKPRIIYSGSASHINVAGDKGVIDDFTHVADAIIASRHDFQWVFVGVAPREVIPYIEAKEMEFHAWQTIEGYPRHMALLEGNMMIAPLADNAFNHAKSNIKYMEASCLGLPIACQDITPYKEAPIRFSSGEVMLKKITETLESEESFLNASRAGRLSVEDKWLELEQNLGMHLDLYSYPFGDPMRRFLRSEMADKG